MSQNNEKTTSMSVIEKINEIEGFDPTPFAVEYTDLSTNEKRLRLPVMIQMAWFRLKYPEGRISVKVAPVNDSFVATARIYPNYKDPVECYLAEATASRTYQADKPSVSPREWAQTAAVGIALRNSGFGLQFAAAGDDFGDIPQDELGIGENNADTGNTDNPETTANKSETEKTEQPASDTPDESEYTVEEPKELSPEEQLQQAMTMPCPITKFAGKSLGEVLTMDPNAINWVATKFTGDENIKKAAELICEYSLQQA